MNVTEVIAKRKSIRAYQEKAVPADVLAGIVEAGQWAPNAGPYQISVITNAGLRKKISDRALDAMLHSANEFLKQRASLPGYQPTYGAPVVIVLSAPADPPFGAANTALAAENMLLEATAAGLGSCYVMTPSLALNGDGNRDLAREAGIPEGYSVHCAVLAGYAAAENKFTLPERNKKGTVNRVE